MGKYHPARALGRYFALVGLFVLLVGMVSMDPLGAIPRATTEPVSTDRGAPDPRRPTEHTLTESGGMEASSSPTVPAQDAAAELAPKLTKKATLTATERADRMAGVISRSIPRSASGNLKTVAGSSPAPKRSGDVMTVRVEVEGGLPVQPKKFAAMVMGILNDERGWGHDGSVRFARTDGAADFRVVLSSPALTDQLCAPLATNGEYSCGREGRAVLNAQRWAQSTEVFLSAGTIQTYREYLITHEVGHVLGHVHQKCPGKGHIAPVMVQQTITLDGCKPNGWVNP